MRYQWSRVKPTVFLNLLELNEILYFLRNVKSMLVPFLSRIRNSKVRKQACNNLQVLCKTLFSWMLFNIDFCLHHIIFAVHITPVCVSIFNTFRIKSVHYIQSHAVKRQQNLLQTTECNVYLSRLL